MRASSLITAALLPFVAGCACDGDLATDPDNYPGSYKSTRFILAGPTDGLDDVGSRGGYITLHMYANGTTDGEAYVPYQSNPSVRQNLRGRYSITGDTVRFVQDEGSVLGSEPMLIRGDEIRTIERPRRGPFEIVLRK